MQRERRDLNASISQNVWVDVEFTCSTQLELSSESTQTQYWVHVWVSPHKLNSVAMSWVQRGNSWVGCKSDPYRPILSWNQKGKRSYLLLSMEKDKFPPNGGILSFSMLNNKYDRLPFWFQARMCLWIYINLTYTKIFEKMNLFSTKTRKNAKW